MKPEIFCEFDFVKKYFIPLTPYGKAYKENLLPFTDKKLIKRKYDAIEVVAEIKKNNRLTYDRIKYHLKNITYISSSKAFSDISDVFLVKKFINNYYAIYKLLSSKARSFFGFEWKLEDLFKYLNPDGLSDNFYISENYDERLKRLRNELTDVFREIEVFKDRFRDDVKKNYGFDLKSDFIIVEAKDIPSNVSDFFTVDIYDSTRIILRPKYSQQYIELLGKREKIVSEIKKIESFVLEDIISKLKKRSDKIFECIEPILELDVAMASYDLAEMFKLKRPQFNTSRIYVKNAVYLPLKKLLDDMNINYIPLSSNFEKRINIIQGSNMGGKTVVLKTLLLLQYMAQCGFFVPADEFITIVFERISVPVACEEVKGLSSFAYEIYEMSEELKKIDKGTVFIVTDEFGKTTNYSEAISIINALIDYFADKKNIYFFLATHFSGIKKAQSVEFLKMKGFNKEKYSRFADIEKKDITERIKFINKFMDYEITKVSDSHIVSSDAIEIAQIIGMDRSICSRAKEYLEEIYGGKKKNTKENKNTCS